MSNKIIYPGPDLNVGETAADTNGSDVSVLVCTKCGAGKVAHSRFQRFDALKMGFTAKQPYRCLHCYHRFWVAENDVASSKRVWTLAIVVVLFVLLLLKLFGVFSAPEQGARVSVIIPEHNGPAASDDSSPSLASLINMSQDTGKAEASANVKDVSNSPQAFTQTPEELLTVEQKARRLLLAKQQAEAAEQLSQSRVEQLEKVLLPADDELESLVKVEVGYVVERWREAWSKGDIDNYLLSYSSDFTPPKDLTLDAWKANRKFRVKPEKNISVKLSDFEVAMLEELNSGVVEFTQRYQSGDYVENSRKRLSLVKQEGTWKIISEVELN